MEGLTEALGRQAGVEGVDLELETATFVVTTVGQRGASADELRLVIESWEGYDYRVGDITTHDG